MLKINDGIPEWDENVTHQEIVDFIISIYTGDLSRMLALNLHDKDDKWKNRLKEVFTETTNRRFEQELKDIITNMNKPFFTNLDISFVKEEGPLISPLVFNRT